MEGSTIVLDKKGGIPVFLIKIGGQPQYSVFYIGLMGFQYIVTYSHFKQG